MRRLVAALVIASIALVLAACGDSGGSAAAPPAPPVSAAPAAAPAAPAPTAPTPVSASSVATHPPVTAANADNKLSPMEAGVNAQFPTDAKSVPAAVSEHLAKHEPMLLFFFDPGQSATADQRAQIDGALRQYRGLIEFVDLDVTGALPDPVTNDASKDPVDEQVALLVQELKIGYTPYVIVVDRQGYMTARYRGFVDQGLLEREILRATQ